MMKFLFAWLCICGVPFTGKSQDTVRLIQNIAPADSLWSYTLQDADLVLKVRIDHHYYMTFSGSFSGTVINVIKGKFGEKKLGFTLGMVELTSERYEKRFRAIDNYNVPFIAYLGFKEAADTNFDLEDKKTGKKYTFFMSAKDLRTKK